MNHAARLRLALVLLAALASTAVAAPAAAPPQPLAIAPAATEYAVAGHPRRGAFLVAWVEPGDEASAPRQVWAQRFGPRGFAVSEPALLGEAPPAGEPAFLSATAMSTPGQYFVVWNRIVGVHPQAVGRRVAFQPAHELEVLADGVVRAAVAPLLGRAWVSVAWLLGGEIEVTVHAPTGEARRRILLTRDGRDFALESAASGNFVVVTRSTGGTESLTAHTFGPEGRLLRRVPVTLDHEMSRLSLAMSRDGGWLVTWLSAGEIRYRRYRPNGTAAGRVRVLGETATSVSAALLQTGEGLLSWYRFDAAGSPVLGQRLDRDGNPVGSRFTIDPQGRAPLVEGRSRRGYVAVWSNQPADESLRGRLLAP